MHYTCNQLSLSQFLLNSDYITTLLLYVISIITQNSVWARCCKPSPCLDKVVLVCNHSSHLQVLCINKMLPSLSIILEECGLCLPKQIPVTLLSALSKESMC